MVFTWLSNVEFARAGEFFSILVQLIQGFQTLGLHAFNALGLQGFKLSLLQSALGIM